jgi:ligand-binding sensor domain-containing protein
MTHQFKTTIRVVLFILMPVATFAQQDYKQFYTIENLLSKELIKSIAKDEEGYLWIATDDGVLRYDGYQTTLFFKELPTNYTKGFLKRKNGQFYILHDFGIKEIIKTNDSVTFQPLTIEGKRYDDRFNYPKSCYEDIHGNLWIGEHNALLRYTKDGLKRFELGDAFRSIDYHRSFSFAEDAFGNLWIAPFKGPLLFYDKKNQALRKIPLSPYLTDVSGITVVNGDYLLIGGKEGILKIKVDSENTILENTLLSTIHDVSTIKCLNNAEVYVGTWNDGLYYFDFENQSNGFKKMPDVPINDVLDLFFDQAKNELWVAGSENIGLFKPSMISTIYSVGENRIESLTMDEADHIYYSIGQQMFYLDSFRDHTSKKIRSVDDTYFARILLEKSRLWVGDAFGKIFYYDLDKNTKQYLLNDQNLSIQYLYKDKSGNKWFTGHTHGLIKVDNEDHLKFYPSLKKTVLTRTSLAGQLFCGENGKDNLLSIYNEVNDTFTTVSLTFEFNCPDDIILNDFQFDSGDNLWLGTNEGLLKIKNEKGVYKTVERVTIPGLREQEPVRALAINDDYICFANASGLVIYKDGPYILFNQEAGLPSKILKERGLVFDRHGNLLVSTAKGMAVIEHGTIQFVPTPKPIFKTLILNGDPMSSGTIESTSFPYKTKLEAEFISLSYPASNILYQTRIVGIDADWSLASGNRNLSVLGFSEGTYALQVRAREDGKLWSEPLVVTFEVLKPWYRRWWAFLIFTVFGVATVMVATSIHNNNLIRQKRDLKKIVVQQTEEVDRQKNEMIEQQKKIIQQKEEIIAKNEAVYKSQHALNEADMNYHQLKEKQLQQQIENKNKQITTHTLNILQKNESLTALRKQLEDIVKNANKISIADIRKTLKTIDESFKLDKDWNDFKLYFEQIHTDFYSKLKVSYPELTPLELRHCALIRLNLTLAECASILGISHDSLKVSRTRLRKKLNLEPSQSLTDFILGI